MKTTFDFAEGETLLIDKPYQWTSFDAVRKVRNLVGIKKVGHAGTLDPLATGLLIVCTGKHTKRINTYQEQEKEYTGTLVLGATTPSYDLETEVVPGGSISGITADQVQMAMQQFTGDILQVPPIFSAIKVDGKRAYEEARKGKELKMEARKVLVTQFVCQAYREGEVDFLVTCSKGTYIRSMAHDLGALLGCGGYLKALRRTKIGAFSVADAITPQALGALLKGNTL